MSNVLNKKAIAVYMENGAEVTREVKFAMADMAGYDILRARLNWPTRDDAPFLFLVLVTYRALVRNGHLTTAIKPEAFVENVISIEPVEEEDEADKS